MDGMRRSGDSPDSPPPGGGHPQSDADSEWSDSADPPPDAERPRILPLLTDAGNRRVLVDWLDTRYDVVPEAVGTEALTDGSVDLCILDPASFGRHRDLLLEQKTAAEPVILPVLLFRGSDTPIEDAGARRAIDDVITTPTSQGELGWRLESLLRLRTLSRSIDRVNGQLEFLLRSAAHDLRNPLQIAKLESARLPDGEGARSIRSAVDRMEHLVENLLAVKRTEGPIAADALEPVALADLVAASWDVIPTGDADLELDALEGERVRLDPPVARQLVENLVRNAVEHGGEAVTVRVGILDEGTGFYLADDGRGIPVDEREGVFDEGSSSDEGSGLGLAIADRVAVSHGWAIAATEGADGGARFEITGVEFVD